MKRYLLSICFILWSLGVFSPASARVIPAALKKSIDSIILSGLNAGAYPGASFVVGDREGVLYSGTYGYQDYSGRKPVTDADVYDVASCTKVLASTFVMMRLYDESKVKLHQTMGELLPALNGSPLSGITVQELLTHTSGIRPQVFYPYLVHAVESARLFNRVKNEEFPYPVEKNLYMTRNIDYDPVYISRQPLDGYRPLCENLYVNPAVDTLILQKIGESYDPARRGRYSYNDSNFYLLQLIIEEITGQPLKTLTEALYQEMDCRNIGFQPASWKENEHIIPTEEDVLLRRTLVQGYPHDELAAVHGGVCGNAGLFANAADIGCFCEMILNKGKYNDRQILSPQTIDLFTSSPLRNRNIYRGLGFDKRSVASGALGGDSSFGHTGFTGTIFWMDKSKGIYMVFLSNSVHPTRTNTKLSAMQIRLKLWEAITGLMR